MIIVCGVCSPRITCNVPPETRAGNVELVYEPGEISDFAALEAFAEFDAPGFRREKPGESAEERRLSGTVTPDNAEVVLHVHVVVQVADQVLVSVAESQLAAFDQRD